MRLTPSGGESGWIVGEIALEQLWRTVDGIRVGNQGYAMLLSEERRVIAHGDPDEKRNVASPPQGAQMPEQALLEKLKTPEGQRNNTAADTTPTRRRVKLARRAYREELTVIVERRPPKPAIRRSSASFVAIALALLNGRPRRLWGRRSSRGFTR